MARNPPWARDELILALDLYFRVSPLHTSEKHPEIVALSKLLNKLPIHTDRPEANVFRNENGVYMKLCNFLRLDPGYQGKGLKAGGKLEETIWKEFAGNRDNLRKVASAIRLGYPTASNEPLPPSVEDNEEEFLEGRVLTTMHKRRERNQSLVRRK